MEGTRMSKTLLMLLAASWLVTGCGELERTTRAVDSSPQRLDEDAQPSTARDHSADAPFSTPEQLTISDPAPQPRYDCEEITRSVGKDVTLSGWCGAADVRSGVMIVSTRDGSEVAISLLEPWPVAVRDEYESCGRCALCAEVKGQLLSHEGKLHFSTREVLRFWRRSD